MCSAEGTYAWPTRTLFSRIRRSCSRSASPSPTAQTSTARTRPPTSNSRVRRPAPAAPKRRVAPPGVVDQELEVRRSGCKRIRGDPLRTADDDPRHRHAQRVVELLEVAPAATPRRAGPDLFDMTVPAASRPVTLGAGAHEQEEVV